MPEPPWIVSVVPWKPKQLRYAVTSLAGVGASPRMATRMPWPSKPAGLQRRDPVGAEDLVRETARGRDHGARDTSWSRSPGLIVPGAGGRPAVDRGRPSLPRVGTPPCWRTRAW